MACKLFFGHIFCSLFILVLHPLKTWAKNRNPHGVSQVKHLHNPLSPGNLFDHIDAIRQYDIARFILFLKPFCYAADFAITHL